MKIAMSGASGFVGRHLTEAFEGRNWKVIPLKREDFKEAGILLGKIEGADVVVNLAGASIAERWTQEYKEVMYNSRVETTKKIAEALAGTEKKPGLFISTSAVGIYDSKGLYTEENAHYADNFLGRLALDWEDAALKAREVVRTVIFRFGIVLGADGGVLQKMLIPFRMGLGGTLGDGKQAFSWIHVQDLVRAYFAVIENRGFEGIYNLTAPRPSTNKGLTRALAGALHRPAIMRVPFFVLRFQLGEGANILLEGQSALPKRLLESGFTFRFAEIEEALKDLFKGEH